MNAKYIANIALLSTLLLGMAPTTNAAETGSETRFHIHIENVSKADALPAPGGKRQGVGMSPGAWAVHTPGSPIFTEGSYDRGQGLEPQSEDGNPARLGESLASVPGVLSSGVFNIPVGAKEPGPIGSGGAFDFEVTAKPGQCLSFTLMFGNSNDWFFSSGDKGIALFDSKGQPIHGNITSRIDLWDAGTEVSEAPGIGPNQAPFQSAPNTGPSEHEPVRRVVDRKEGFTYPSVAKILRVTITPER